MTSTTVVATHVEGAIGARLVRVLATPPRLLWSGPQVLYRALAIPRRGYAAAEQVRRAQRAGRLSEAELDALQARAFQELAERVLADHGVVRSVYGQATLGPALVVANHVSYLDPLVVIASVPAVPMAKSSVAAWPVVGPVARALGTCFVDRRRATRAARALDSAQRKLTSGVSLLTFPEGTTSKGEGVLPFKNGVFRVALRANVPVLPVALAYASPTAAWTGSDWFLPHYLSEVALRSETPVAVRIGEPLNSSCFGSSAELAATAQRSVAALLRELRS